MFIETSNFENYSSDEYSKNLIRLGLDSHSSLVGKSVYYSKEIYGKHSVIEWSTERAEYLLDLDGQKFWSNPFRIFIS